jgi:hypothetical protein
MQHMENIFHMQIALFVSTQSMPFQEQHLFFNITQLAQSVIRWLISPSFLGYAQVKQFG